MSQQGDPNNGNNILNQNILNQQIQANSFTSQTFPMNFSSFPTLGSANPSSHFQDSSISQQPLQQQTMYTMAMGSQSPSQEQSELQKNLKKMSSTSSTFVPKGDQKFGGGVPNFLSTPNMQPGSSYSPNGMGMMGQQQQGVNSEQNYSSQSEQPQQTQGMSEQQQSEQDKELDKIVQNILNLRNIDKREEALQELSKKRETYPNLAPLLWHSVGTITILIQDIVAIYPSLSPPNLTPSNSSRVCSVLGLLQCLALHPETKGYFLNAHVPLFLYPFLNTNNKSKPFENLRVTSLGVIGALVKGDDTDAITFLMQTEIIPLCLRIMKRGQELSRTVATFIVQKILLDENGLNYICQTAERFFAVSTVLQSMIDDLAESEKEDQRLLRHIIRCYLRLSENSRANEALTQCLPVILKDTNSKLITDDVVKRWHTSLLQNLRMLPQ